jgi:phosphatidylserine decarboxylase precursor-related protein
MVLSAEAAASFVVCILIISILFSVVFYRHANINLDDDNYDEDVVYSPAQGKIYSVNVITNPENNRQYVHFITILTVMDIHRQYAPIAGTVEKVHHKKTGIFEAIVGKIGRIGNDNERVTQVFRGKHGEVMVEQIAGKYTHRIKHSRKVGDDVIPGDYIGMILLGSRVDVYVEVDASSAYVIDCKAGQKIKPGDKLMHWIDRRPH